jgi:hypothetical protein
MSFIALPGTSCNRPSALVCSCASICAMFCTGAQNRS